MPYALADPQWVKQTKRNGFGITKVYSLYGMLAEMPLHDLRRARALSQKTMADLLETS